MIPLGSPGNPNGSRSRAKIRAKPRARTRATLLGAALGLVCAHPGPAVAALGAQEEIDGDRLMRSLGCGSCHVGVEQDEAIRAAAPRLGPGSAPLAPAYLFHYLADPQAIRPDIAPARMPRYDLDERERVALAMFLAAEEAMQGVDAAFLAARGRHPDVDAGHGRAVFERLNCAGCHNHELVTHRRTAPDLSAQGLRVRPRWLTAYLEDPVPIRPMGDSPGSGGRMPDFGLSPEEVTAITGALAGRRAGDTASWEPLALSAFSMAKADALLRTRWSCLGCHQLGQDGGRVGPRLDGIRDRLQPSFVRTMIERPDHGAPGTIMPASLEQSDRINLIASYLWHRTGEWVGSSVVDPALTGQPMVGDFDDAGAALYRARCAPCHGVEGGGDGFNAPFLPSPPTVHADSLAMSLRPDDTLYDGIHAGGWILGKSARMPAFGASLDDDQIRALVAYIRTLCRCLGPAWSRDGIGRTPSLQ